MNEDLGTERIVTQTRVLGLRLLLSRRRLSTLKAAESRADSAVQDLRRHFQSSLPIWLTLCGVLLSAQLTPTASAEDSCQLGSESLVRKDFKVAEAFLKECIAGEPREVGPYLALCGLYQSQGRTKDLHEVALAGLDRFPGEKRFYLTVGIQAGQEERYERAIEVFSEGFRRWPADVVLKKNLASAHLLLGMKRLDESKNPEAESHLRKATELAEDDVEAHLNLGRALHNLSQSVEALAEFDRVLALNEQTPLAHFHRGLVLYSLHETDAAISEFDQEIKSNPSYPPSFLFRGHALMAKGEWASALPDLNLAVTKMPENPKAVLARARCLNRLGQLKEAEADFRKAVEMDPANPEALNGLARVLSLTGRDQEAEALFEKARKLNREIRSASPGEIRFDSAEGKKN